MNQKFSILYRKWHECKILSEIEEFEKGQERYMYVFENVYVLRDWHPINLMKHHNHYDYFRFRLETSEEFHEFGERIQKYNSVPIILLEIDLSMVIFPRESIKSGFVYDKRFIQFPDLCALIARCSKKGYKVIIFGYLPDEVIIHRNKGKLVNAFNANTEKYLDEIKREDNILRARTALVNDRKKWKPYLKVISPDAFYTMILEMNEYRERELEIYINHSKEGKRYES